MAKYRKKQQNWQKPCFLAPPLLEWKKYFENATKHNAVYWLDVQLLYHEVFVYVKFKGQKLEKQKNVRFFEKII